MRPSIVLTGRNSTFRTIQSIRCTSYFWLSPPDVLSSAANLVCAHPVPVKVFKEHKRRSWSKPFGPRVSALDFRPIRRRSTRCLTFTILTANSRPADDTRDKLPQIKPRLDLSTNRATGETEVPTAPSPPISGWRENLSNPPNGSILILRIIADFFHDRRFSEEKAKGPKFRIEDRRGLRS